MPNSVVSIDDGKLISVDDVMNDPKSVPQRVLDLVRDNIIGEVMFRNAGNPGGLLLAFERMKPRYLSGDPEGIAEFGEIPVFGTDLGEPDVARGLKSGAAVRISREMKDFNKIDKVRQDTIAASNTIIRQNDAAFRATLEAAGVPEVAAGVAWDGTGAKPRHDIKEAMKTVATATFDGDASQPMGFTPNTLVLNSALLYDFMDSDEFKSVYTGDVSHDNISYTGVMPGTIMGLTVLTSPLWPLDKGLVLERGVTGFYADARPLQGTPLYGEGGGPNGGPTESWRSDMTQIRAIGVDEPLSACWITGLQ